MIARIEQTPVQYPFTFTMLGDSGAGPNPVGDLIFTTMLDQMSNLSPAPLFMANIGDFAGPGTLDRHEHYLNLVDKLSIPNICLSGNHDCDNPSGFANFEQVYGAHNFQFAYGNTCFICINGHGGTNYQGPQQEDIEFLEACLKADDHPIRIIMLHMPPYFNGRYTPHPDWGFRQHEAEFLQLVKAYDVKLVCCAHVLAYDHMVWGDTHFVVSGGGGWGICSHYGVCEFGWDAGTPPEHGAFYHFVQITIHESGIIDGHVYMACEGTKPDHRYHFTTAH
jgi:hypothetical protein